VQHPPRQRVHTDERLDASHGGRDGPGRGCLPNEIAYARMVVDRKTSSSFVNRIRSASQQY
jgi:hypothetical protein